LGQVRQEYGGPAAVRSILCQAHSFPKGRLRECRFRRMRFV
jgi:hypothetical protein